MKGEEASSALLAIARPPGCDESGHALSSSRRDRLLLPRRVMISAVIWSPGRSPRKAESIFSVLWAGLAPGPACSSSVQSAFILCGVVPVVTAEVVSKRGRSTLFAAAHHVRSTLWPLSLSPAVSHCLPVHHLGVVRLFGKRTLTAMLPR